MKSLFENVCWFGFFFGYAWFYGTSSIVNYECQIYFDTYKQFNFKQFSLAYVHSFLYLTHR